MKLGQKVTHYLLSGLLAVGVALLLAGCGGGGGGSSSSGGGGATTTISGKVTLSGTAAGTCVSNCKPSLKAKPRATMAPMMANAKGKPFGKVVNGSPSSPGGRLAKLVQRTASQAATLLPNTIVNLYDTDHPEWLYPIATSTTDNNGQYKLSTLVYATENGASYNNDDLIPEGNYTLIASGKDFSTSAVTTTTYPYQDQVTGKAYRNVIAIQAIVKKYTGDVTGNDLSAQSSDAVPQVVSIMGKKVGSLSTTPGGEYDLGTIFNNVAIQVTFDMAMHRVSTPTAITLKDSGGTTVDGKWKMSSDLTAATFYPTAALTETSKYKLLVSSTQTANYYGKGLKADVAAVYTAGPADTTDPNAIFVSPGSQTGVDITTAIKIAANEPMDVNTITVTSTPSIGSKPTVKSLGYSNVTGQYDYFYQIIPSDPLQLNTDYAVTVSGGKDLAGNAMTAVTSNFKTAATSSGVTGTGGTVTDQTNVKSVVGKWVDAMNAGDITLFSSMLTGEFSYSYANSSTNCDVSSPCAFDINKDGKLSYKSFIKFIQNWFNTNSKIAGWTGDSSGVHLSGDVIGDIIVDPSTGTAGFKLQLTYLNADGTVNTSLQIQPLYVLMQDQNGAWYMSNLSDKDNTGTVGANTGVITTGDPLSGAALAQGTKTLTFNWTPVSGVTSYAVVLTDNADPTGSTGWVGIVDGQPASSFSFSSLADLDATDGKLVLIGGGLNAPFSKELKLQDGGSYTWFVAGFKTLTASSFLTGTVSPDADISAVSSGSGFSIQGTATAAALTVTPKTTTGTALSFSDGLYAWDAGTANSVTLEISSATGTSGYVYVYGNNYASKAFNFDSVTHKATVTVDLFNGYNWIDVSDNTNWWYATTGQTHTSYASNYIYTTGGVSYNTLTVDSVTAGLPITSDASGYYNLPSTSLATSVTIKGKTSPGNTLYITNSAYTLSYQSWYTTTSVTADANGAYTATVDMYTGYNWLSIYDNYSNWAYVNIYNLGMGAAYVSPISNVLVNGNGPDGGSGTTYTVNTSANVTVSGSAKVSGSGYWYQYNSTNFAYTSGTFSVANGIFSISIPAGSGNNYIDLYDANWNYQGITVNNTGGVLQPNTITTIDGYGQTPTQNSYYNYTNTSCSVAINGYSPASVYGPVYVYLYNYNSATGASSYDYQTLTADASGNYAFNQAVYAGTNYIDVYDTNWIWQGVQVTNTGACAPVTFNATSVSDSGGQKIPDTSGYYNTADTSLTVTGNAGSGKTITAYVYGNYYGTYTATAGAGNTYSINVPVYSGYNYIDLTDGTNWVYLNVYNSGTGATYTSPISSVKVDGAPADSGGTAADTWADWYNITAGSVTITGNTTLDGTGTYYSYGSTTSSSGTFTISGGQFSLPVNLEYGYNYIDLYDANWNYYSVYIYTTGGTNAPSQIVTITSPTHNATVSGSWTVTGTVNTASMTPAYIYAYIFDYTAGQYKVGYWDNGVTPDVTALGYLPLTYSSGNFSVNTTFTAGNETLVEIDAYDINWLGHGNYIYVNNSAGYSSVFYKPGTKATARDFRSKSHHSEFVKQMMKHRAR